MQSNKSNGALTAQINVSDHKKSGFDLSNNVLGTGKIGRIIPTRALHVMPGDTIKQDSKAAVQFEPLAVPILANMDVKQEHFYVPYNVVWKNWDKFISGGEKMDYKGVVPNVSMSKILRTIVNTLNLHTVKFLPSLQGDVEYLDFTPGFSVYRDLKIALDFAAGSLNIKDLLAPQYKAIEMIRDFDLNNEVYPTHFDFVLVEPVSAEAAATPAGREQTYTNYLNEYGLIGNKYLEEIRPYVVDLLESQGLWLPTLQGFDKFVLFYEFIKPFCGLGSNIDFLNMGRLSLSEFILMQCLSITKLYYEHDDAFSEFYYASLDLGQRNASITPMSILHLRANYSVWYNNYRDILLEADAFEPVDEDEVTDNELFVLLIPRQRCWEKDAFTTALDNPGTGNVGVPLTSQFIGADYVVSKIHLDSPEGSIANSSDIASISFNGEEWKLPTSLLTGINPLNEDGSELQGFSLYALDAAQRAQKWLQKALYFGNRISDFYYLRFGVRYLDARLRLPELLTSSSELVKLDVVMNNTSIPSENVIAGDRAAYASAYDNGNSFDRFCEEHGVILSYLTIMPQITYAYGMSRDYSRIDQFDFAFSEFATLGMDAVYDTEVTSTSFYPIDGSHYQGPQVFGYQGKYYDYKAKHSEEHGELLDTQDMYTFSRKFNMFDLDGRPKLNYEFVHCFPSLDMFVVDSPFADYFRFDIRHSTAAERNLPSQSIYI